MRMYLELSTFAFCTLPLSTLCIWLEERGPMGLVNELCLNPGQFVSFRACASEPGCPGTSKVRHPSWRMKTLFFSCWRGLHPQSVTVSPPVYVLKSLSSWWWFLFHLGLPVGGGDIASRGPSLHPQGRRCCWYNSGGVVMHCLWCCATGVGERKGEFSLGRERVQRFPHFRLLLSLD